jgi:hypothetical protein
VGAESGGHRREVEAQSGSPAIAAFTEWHCAELVGVRVDEVARDSELLGDASGVDPLVRAGHRRLSQELHDTPCHEFDELLWT